MDISKLPVVLHLRSSPDELRQLERQLKNMGAIPPTPPIPSSEVSWNTPIKKEPKNFKEAIEDLWVTLSEGAESLGFGIENQGLSYQSSDWYGELIDGLKRTISFCFYLWILVFVCFLPAMLIVKIFQWAFLNG